jgi:hypothetical protein
MTKTKAPKKPKARKPSAEVIQLHPDRITVTLSAKVSRLIWAEMERLGRKGLRVKTPEEIVEESTEFTCSAMAEYAA